MEKEKEETIGITWRVPVSAKERLVEMFGSSSAKNVQEAVLDAFFNKLPEAEKKVAELEKQVAEVKENPVSGVPESVMQAAKDKIAELEKLVETTSESLADANDRINQLEQTLEDKITENKELSAKADDPEIIVIPVRNKIVRDFLEAVKSNLEEIYEREVSYYDIFVLSTLQYNVEKRCDWFYPPLKAKKIEEITGKTIKEWNRFLSQKEK